jgi:hypothetical protein
VTKLQFCGQSVERFGQSELYNAIESNITEKCQLLLFLFVRWAHSTVFRVSLCSEF